MSHTHKKGKKKYIMSHMTTHAISTHIENIVATDILGLDDILNPLDSEESEDIDISEDAFYGSPSSNLFDQAWTYKLPLISQLPYKLRYPLRAFIDDEYKVTWLDKCTDSVSELSQLIASAITRHLRNKNIRLSDIGDWRRIPAIETDEKLIKLITVEILSEGILAKDVTKEIESLPTKFKHLGSQAKRFSIIFSNGDVVTPQSLIYKAQEVHLANIPTRAGTFRESIFRNKLTYELGETEDDFWASFDWVKFEKAEKKSTKTKSTVD